MSNWQVFPPRATVNLVPNPSVEVDITYYANWSGNTLERDTGISLFGGASLLYQRGPFGNDGIFEVSNDGASNWVFPTANTTYLASCYVLVDPTGDRWNVENMYIRWEISGYTGGSRATKAYWKTTDSYSRWYRIYGALYISNDLTGKLFLEATETAASGILSIDGIQVETVYEGLNIKDRALKPTTYCDGSQRGCEWTGARHASVSYRPASAIGGGQEFDFEDELYTTIHGVAGLGVAGIQNSSNSLALQAGSQHTGQKTLNRNINLAASIIGTDMVNYHDKRRALLKALLPTERPLNIDNAVRLFHYNGKTEPEDTSVDDVRQFYAVYQSGLEGLLEAGKFASETDLNITLIADEPYFYEVGDQSLDLDVANSATFSNVARFKEGLWDNMGPPDAGGTYPGALVVKKGPDGLIYFGGVFSSFDNDVDADKLVTWDPIGETWAPVASGINGSVRGIDFDATANLYIGGTFTNLGDANGDYVSCYDGSWNSLGTGMDGVVYDILYHTDGNVYATGAFTSAGGVADTAFIAYWDGSTWNPLGTGLNSAGHSLASAPDGGLYVGGDFTTANGVSASRMAKWNGTTFEALSTGLNGIVRAIAVAPSGDVFVGGDFTTAGGKTANYVARWGGFAWYAVGDTAFDDVVYSLVLNSDQTLWCGGLFDAIGSTVARGLSFWNGSVWTVPDLWLPAAKNVLGMASADGVLYLAHDADAATEYAGTTTVDYFGTAPAQPVIYIKRSGGTSARLFTIRNTSTGANLYLDYSLQDGEELSIDLRQTGFKVTSSIFGPRWDAIKPNSDITTFNIAPGYVMTGTDDDVPLPEQKTNIIAIFVASTGAPTMTGSLEYKTAYASAD